MVKYSPVFNLNSGQNIRTMITLIIYNCYLKNFWSGWQCYIYHEGRPWLRGSDVIRNPEFGGPQHVNQKHLFIKAILSSHSVVTVGGEWTWKNILQCQSWVGLESASRKKIESGVLKDEMFCHTAAGCFPSVFKPQAGGLTDITPEYLTDVLAGNVGARLLRGRMQGIKGLFSIKNCYFEVMIYYVPVYEFQATPRRRRWR